MSRLAQYIPDEADDHNAALSLLDRAFFFALFKAGHRNETTLEHYHRASNRKWNWLRQNGLSVGLSDKEVSQLIGQGQDHPEFDSP